MVELLSESTPNSEERDKATGAFADEVFEAGMRAPESTAAVIGFRAGWDAVLAAGYRPQDAALAQAWQEGAVHAKETKCLFTDPGDQCPANPYRS